MRLLMLSAFFFLWPVRVPVASSVSAIRASAVAGYRPTLEVQLRKVHIVRPDLIPYPVAFEVVC